MIPADVWPDLLALPPLDLDGIVVDFPNGVVQRDGLVVSLTPYQWRMLVLFARHPRCVLPPHQIIRQVWGDAYADAGRIPSVWMCVSRLRRKIERNPAAPRFLRTQPKVGYGLYPPPGWTPSAAGGVPWVPRLVGALEETARVVRQDDATVQALATVLTDALTAWLAAQGAPPVLAEQEIGGAP